MQITGASQCYLEFENVRVMKDMRNRVNRQVNCETANLQKSVDAALRQLQSGAPGYEVYGPLGIAPKSQRGSRKKAGKSS